MKSLIIKCPCCDEDLIITIENDNVIVNYENQVEVSEELLSKLNIEFG